MSVTSNQRKLDAYHAGNPEAARIIAADPAKYPPDSLPVVWAAMILNPPAERTAPATREAA